MIKINLKKYWKVWWTSLKLSLQSNLASKGASFMFVLGKFLRFFFFIYFLTILKGNIKQIAGYDYSHLFTFYLIFNLFDMFGQIFFRGIYWFRRQIISGEFDFRLVKPINPLFQALTRHTDFLDTPLLILVIITLLRQGLNTSSTTLINFSIVSIAGIVIITGFHALVAALGVLTTEVDHTIMIYRDLSLMARFPIDIYSSFIRALLTFIIPIALVFTYPAKALLGLFTLYNSIMIFIGSIIFFYISNGVWKFALTKYSSASS